MQEHRGLSPAGRCLLARAPAGTEARGVWTVWHAHVYGGQGQYRQRIVTLGVNAQGERTRTLEELGEGLRNLEGGEKAALSSAGRLEMVRGVFPDMLRREMAHTGTMTNGATCAARLLAWVELG
jgi:hypothetical protein